MCRRMNQDAESGYDNAELSSIRVDPNHAVPVYSYQIPAPIASTPVYGSAGTGMRIADN